MSSWPGKYVIGLTGNIATGKSVVRRMLEHLGAYTIDADTLSHRAIARGAPGYQPVVEAFGKYLLDANGEVIRSRLSHIVFSDREALQQLESIVHPLVEQAIDLMIRRARQPVVVIEAIKLLEGPIAKKCDAIWVTSAPAPVQKARLIKRGGMSDAEATQRIQAQAPQALKIGAATVVIQNDGSFEKTWKEVVVGWNAIPVAQAADTAPVVIHREATGDLAVQRGRPRDSNTIADLINRLGDGKHRETADDIMAAFGEKAYLLLTSDHQPVGLIGWQVENLVARTTDLYLDPKIARPPAIKALVTEVERASRDLQCEAALLFLQPPMAAEEKIWKDLGYIPRTPETLGVRAWQDAAHESQQPGTALFFKQLRQDRILRPI